MAKTNRDDFPPIVIRKLKERYNLLCSNPDCRATTSCPHQHDDEKSVCIGKAAHICAAAPGGPRYDIMMTREQRRGINNAIWLCGPCADKIDKDEKAYPKELLHQWKEAAAASLIDGLGKKLPNNSDAVDTLMMAMTGASKTTLLSAVPNVCSATSQSLEQLDPRFTVKTSFHNNSTEFTIFPKENVNFKLKVNQDYNEEFSRKFRNLMQAGEPLEIDSLAIMFEGSRLLEFITEDSKKGKLILSSTLKKSSVQKIILRDSETSEYFYIDDIHGEISAGSESFRFTGETYGGMIKLNYTCKLELNNTGPLDFTLNIDTDKWRSHYIGVLPYFDKIRKLFKLLNSNCELKTTLEMDGVTIFTATAPEFKPKENTHYYAMFCDYLHLANAVLSKFDKKVIFDSSITYTRDMHERLLLLNATLNGEYIATEDIGSNATCTLTAEDDLTNIHLISEAITEPREIRFEQCSGEVLELFGETIQLPRSYVVITNVSPLLNVKLENIQPGDEVFVEWVPQEGCQVITGFLEE